MNTVTNPTPNTEDLPRAVADAAQRGAPVNSDLVASNNQFGFDVFHELWKTDSDKSVFLSPTSFSLALEIAYNGALNTTQEAMAKTMHLTGVSMPDLNSRNAALQASLHNPDPKVELNIANALWMRDKAVKPGFVQVNENYYGSEIGDMSGLPDSANNWVSGKTQGKITQILPKMDYSQLVAVIVNAVYFKGEWAQKFDAAQTTDAQFTRADGSKVACKMMHQSGHYDYFKGDSFQAVRLPYGAKRMSMILLLPDTGTDLNGFLATITPDNWNAWITKLQDAPGEVALPRFTSDYSAALKEPLTKLGMGIAFDPNHADFTNLADGAYIAFVQHKTFVEVNEEGTEAAAATGVGVGATAIRPPFHMTLDHPFFYAIRDDKTGAILFLGVLLEPKA
jgi:serpin B